MTGRAWVLNLDAEDELAALRAGRPYAPRPASAARNAASDTLRRTWLGPSDTVLEDTAPAQVATPPLESGLLEAGTLGRAWMPTPRALDTLRRAGATVPKAPPAEVLIAANARETFRGGADLPGSITVRSAEELLVALQRSAPRRAPGSERAPGWLVRPSLTTAGQGRLVVDAGAVSTDPSWAERARNYAAKHLAAGPLDVAPLVDVDEELALHGWLDGPDALRVGAPVRSTCSGGVWRGARRAVGHPLAAPLRSALEEVADTLAGLGYFGPFGIDALVWVDTNGARRLHAPLEVNARYTMAYPLELGAAEG